ncbi:hypothetical protein [Blastococcus brunescens]|uniref:Uncharacterized protein n=1 Tax=Blastococcus brunescens TaxID=1564165 RepID=A0ABZ1AXL5_9ACTN|nr:hypothetical protein [Blastococcus sp. BMG 8361]WRL62403.1 hypothetical protein U6N30_20580 [Blastococcus sp. BMG 8361]
MADEPPYAGVAGQVVSHGGRNWVWDPNLSQWVGNLMLEFDRDHARRPPLHKEAIDDIRDVDR